MRCNTAMTQADRIARLEHVQHLQTLLLHAILDDLPPTDRWRVLDRLHTAVSCMEPVREVADVAGAAWLSLLVAPR
jgi:hypothetical protein